MGAAMVAAVNLAGGVMAEEQAKPVWSLGKCLVISSVGRYGRNALHQDALEARIVAGTWAAPMEGEKVSVPQGEERTWETAEAGKDGWLRGRALSGGYVYASVELDRPRVLLLAAAGHSLVYVNGEPRTGDPYSTEYVRLPVALRAGRNDLLFQCGRGQLKADLLEPGGELLPDARDTTLPDLMRGENGLLWGALLVTNAGTKPRSGLTLAATVEGGATTRTKIPTLAPLSVRKVGFRFRPAAGAAKTASLTVRLLGVRGETAPTAALSVRRREPLEVHKRTFLSGMDGSVQYYAVNPAHPVAPKGPAPALFLSLHGASVEALGQAEAYSPKSWGNLVAPTNRRPYGFDWEDWGRKDALEVLAEAKKRYRPDPSRVYLTGHSMGGHGTWQVGVTYPGLFAALGPSAGWISLWSYAGAARPQNPTPMEAMLLRSSAPSDTLSLVKNTKGLGVYILHGEADDNVPPSEARLMKETLSTFHHDFYYHEEPDQGHWWDLSPEPGADCVDWAPMFDLFARHRLPQPGTIRQVEFATASPGVSAWRDWAGIEAQIHPLELSTVSLRCDPGLRLYTGKTQNVARLALKLENLEPGQPLSLELDGQKLEKVAWPASGQLTLLREGDAWRVTEPASPALKGPQRYGPFREAFGSRVMLVYGTRGSAEENAWSYARARLDAETFWVRGNGSVDLAADMVLDPHRDLDRSIVLYGSAETNGAWTPLLGGSPVQVTRGLVKIGDREYRGQDLACLFLRPRPGSDTACVAAVSGSGLPGLRLTDRMAYFTAGITYPDCIVLGPEVLSQGPQGVRAAGYFAQDWSVPTGDWVWQ
jgi:dienelactone hydrolase